MMDTLNSNCEYDERNNQNQQIQNLNGVAMYLRGKLPSEEEGETAEVDSIERTDEYPDS